MKCEKCDREGQLVIQQACPVFEEIGLLIPYVVRIYLCRYHRSGWNRTRKDKISVLEYKEDREVIKDPNLWNVKVHGTGPLTGDY